MQRTRTDPVAGRPPILRATRELGLRDRDLARLFGVSVGSMGDWAQGTRPLPHVKHAALLFVVTRLVGIIGEDDPPSTRYARRLAMAREIAQRWAELARDELPDLPDEVLDAGFELGAEILAKLEAEEGHG